jgi:hypothetical protein
MVNRVPKLRDETIRQRLLNLGVIAQISHELNRALHDHGLVILLSFALDFGLDDLEECLEV